MNKPNSLALVLTTIALAGGITATVLTENWRWTVTGLAIGMVIAAIGNARETQASIITVTAGALALAVGLIGWVWIDWRWIAISIPVALVIAVVAVATEKKQ